MLIKSVFLALAKAHNARSYIFLLVGELSTKRDISVAYIMIEFDYAKRHSGGVVLQRFEL